MVDKATVADPVTSPLTPFPLRLRLQDSRIDVQADS